MRKSLPAITPREEEAAHWAMRLSETPDLQTTPEFRAWLAQDPRHAAALQRAARVWSLAGVAGRDVALPAAPQKAVSSAGRAVWRLAGILGGAGLAAAVVAALWIGTLRPDIWLRATADYAAAPGERREIALADGSTVLLDARSAMDVNLVGPERRVTLLTGAAYFDVAQDGRPFVVRSGEAEVHVLGTRFDLRRGAGDTVVTLESGSVEVRSRARETVTLTPGQQLRQEPGRAPELREVLVADALDWREGRYTFYDVPLREVMDQLTRAGVGPILFARSGLATRRITGSVMLDSPDQALSQLSAGLGVTIRSLPGVTLLY